MWTLALDTTAAAGSVALARDARLLEVSAIDPSQPIATRVPADLMALLDRHRVSLADIRLAAVATGPGSFTGLRIGIAAMQGLSLANAIPLIGVSSFEALASLAPAGENVAVWIDAWRGEVYGAVYTGAGAHTLREIVEPAVAPPEELLRKAASLDLGNTIFIGDGAVKYRGEIPGRVIEPTPLIGGAIAQIANARAAQGEAPPPHAIRPLYVRRPDAVLAREKASG
jgi:tRNA threonylcarbamoyladenosine biosynthesis protein TsaB